MRGFEFISSYFIEYVMEMSIYLQAQPKELLSPSENTFRNSYTKLSSFAIISGEWDLNIVPSS